MSPYILAGPLVALVGIVAVVFVMRHKAVQTRSMYSSRRSNLERKVKAARQRTLAPRGRGEHAPTDQEIAAGATAISAAPAYVPPAAAPRQPAWDAGPAPAPSAFAAPPVAPPPVYTPPAATPTYAPAEPTTPTPAEPVWTPAPAEPAWTPAPAPDTSPAPSQQTSAPEPLTPAESGSGGASWSVVGDAKEATMGEAPKADKGKRKDKTATGSSWELASAVAPSDDAADEVKAPSTALALAQYAVLVVGLIMVLIGVLVMVANQKVT
jgi:uncharacterized integral membrane protein